jgi:hypothetical protein
MNKINAADIDTWHANYMPMYMRIGRMLNYDGTASVLMSTLHPQSMFDICIATLYRGAGGTVASRIRYYDDLASAQRDFAEIVRINR